METFEMLSPVLMFYIYFVSAIAVTLIFRVVFKKSSTYYVIFLAAAVLFGVFSKEFIPYLPYDVMDIPRIVGKLSGALGGLLVIHIWLRQRKPKRSRLA